MENIDLVKIYYRISAKGLLPELIERVKAERPKASRNTIWLSFKEGPTTATRVMILEIAHKLIEEKEQLETAEALVA